MIFSGQLTQKLNWSVNCAALEWCKARYLKLVDEAGRGCIFQFSFGEGLLPQLGLFFLFLGKPPQQVALWFSFKPTSKRGITLNKRPRQGTERCHLFEGQTSRFVFFGRRGFP